MPLHLSARKCAGESPPRLSRRAFLASTTATGLSLWLDRADPRPAPHWALIADTHIHAERNHVVRGANMADHLARVVEATTAVRPAAVVFNGDLAFAKGRTDDYAQFRNIAAPLLNGTGALHVALGNHDRRDALLDALGLAADGPVVEKYVSNRACESARMLFLDSLEPTLRYAGRLGRAQRVWLRRTLDADRRTPTVVFVHHNPDDGLIGLQDGDALRELLLPRRQVKAVFFGHTHEYRVWTEDGLHFVNQPATGFRFKPAAPLGWLNAEWRADGVRLEFQPIDPARAPPDACRILHWRADPER